MSINCKNLVVLLLLIFSVALIGSAQAQGQPDAKPDFGDGALEEASEQIEKLLQLKWNGQNLALKREWDELAKKKLKNKNAGKDDELEEVTENLIEHTLSAEQLKQLADLVDRGLPEDQAARIVELVEQGAKQMAEKMIADGNPAEALRKLGVSNPSGVEKVFRAALSEVGAVTARNSGGGIERRLRFSNQSFSGLAVLENNGLRFEFAEKKGKKRSFEVGDDGQGRFKFEFKFDHLFLKLIQSKTGKTQLIWIDDGKVEVYVGDSFSHFRKRNRQVVDEMLFPLFECLGIKPPDDVPDP